MRAKIFVSSTADRRRVVMTRPGMQTVWLKNAVVCAVLLAVASMAISQASATILANSVADFGDTQGANGWFYGYYDKTADSDFVYDYQTDFRLMSQYRQNHQLSAFASGPAWEVQDGVYFTELWANGGHGNGTTTSGGRRQEQQFAVRRWVSDYVGNVDIAVHLAKIDGNPTSNGVAGRVIIEGNQVRWDYVSGTDLTGITYTLSATVHVGDRIDLMLDPWAANDWGDSSIFTAQITATPEPSTVVLLGIGAVSLLAYWWSGPSNAIQSR
jgi:hypothetical protein